MLGTTMCRTTHWIDDAVYPIPILSYVWEWQRRQACFSTYRGKLEYAEAQAEG